MAGRYEEAADNIRVLVASTLDEATQQDRAFVAGASQALANRTEKYQLATSQGENQSLHDQLAHWVQVRQARVTLSQKITSLTTDYEPSTTSSEIFRALLPDCFRRVRARTEATFHELHATLPTLLCQFVTVCFGTPVLPADLFVLSPGYEVPLDLATIPRPLVNTFCGS